jgi:hypothetical protein
MSTPIEAAARRMPAVFFGHGSPMNAIESNRGPSASLHDPRVMPPDDTNV